MKETVKKEEQLLWFRQTQLYEKIGLAIFYKAFERILSNLPYQNMTTQNYKNVVLINIGNSDIFEPMRQLYTRVAVTHGALVQREIEGSLPSKRLGLFNRAITDYITNYLRRYAGRKIKSMRRTLAQKVIKAIADLIEREEPDTFRSIVEDIKSKVLGDAFYRYEVHRIVRTEITTAANVTAAETATRSGLVLTKKWIATFDERVRTKGWDHLEKNGEITGELELFEFVNNVSGEKDYLQHPGDQNGHPGNVINCRCRVIYRAKRDEQGRLILKPKDESGQVLTANTQ